MKSLLLGICILLVSCNGQKKALIRNNEVKGGNDKKLVLLLQDNYSGSDIAETLIIKDSKTLKNFYLKINRTRKPGLPVPEIDFAKEMVVVHCSGLQKNRFVPSLVIEEETTEELILATSGKPLREKGGASAEINPFCMYKMPLTSKRITFKKEQ